MKKAGIYLSIPFCRQKCTFCNFASDAYAVSLLNPYLRFLETEVRQWTNLWRQAGIPSFLDTIDADTIYLGGGTPGLLNSEQLTRLLEAVRSAFQIEEEPEITIEASPENATAGQSASWAACGINRVSMGVQSMVPQELRSVGRMHSPETVAQAFSALRNAGLENISADLIAGLPYQTAQSFQNSLQALLDLGPTHFSVYILEVDEDSRLGREILENGSRYRASSVPSEEQVVAFYCAAMELLRQAGFHHYEISNFARRGYESRHNQKYWTGVPYFGFGVEAHSYDGERRWANTDSLSAYLERMQQGQSPIAAFRTLRPQEKLEEHIFLGLRQRQGISLSRLHTEFATDLREIHGRQLHEFSESGWLETSEDILRLTDRGLLFSNEVFAGFLT
ncbi:MAG: radical SAM family heme chaperone HemW [Acidobacteria bacterium]|nr:radical SAM family heme chaperone HemW [Acidobacteriota bacterium]